MPRKARETKPAATWQVQQALARADDFVTLAQVKQMTGLDSNHASAALHHLKKYHVVESMESDGHLWWYLTGRDDRTLVKEEVTVEDKPRKVRRSRLPKA